MRHSGKAPEPRTHGNHLSARKRRELRWIFAVIFGANVAAPPAHARPVPFAPQSVEPSLNVPLAVSVFDGDRDGDLDAVVSSLGPSGSTLYWYENSDGNGTFAEPQPIATADDFEPLAVADIDGDGDLDLVFSAGYSEISWSENNGDGGFAAPQLLLPSVAHPSAITTADLDGDGDLDLVTTSSASTDGVYWYANDPLDTGAKGTFGTEQVISLVPQVPRAVVAADLDGDGDLDVAAGTGSASGVTWYRNDGAGTFSTQPALSTDTSDIRSLVAADIDGDGDLDLLAADYDDDRISWFENAGGGAFASAVSIATDAPGANSLYVADLDGDGDLDVAATSHDDDTVAWFENSDGAGAFGSRQTIGTLNEAGQAFAGDIDGDGDLDVVAAEVSESGSVAWYENETIHRSALFLEQTVISTAGDGVRAVFAADLDGDGDRDVLTASFFDDELAWYQNIDGQAVFGPQQVFSTSGNGAAAVFAADLDGDGDRDVLAASLFDGAIAWYENSDGLGHFVFQQLLGTLSEARSVFAADLDGDGDLDALAASQGDGTIAWYENSDGLGNFGSAQVISTVAIAAFSAVAADLDGDGDLDVVSAQSGTDSIAWYENSDGNGSFGPQQSLSTLGDFGEAVQAADIDGDGDLDVLAGLGGEEAIAWYENTDGHGGFGSQRAISTVAVVGTSVFAADVDGDGDLDVLAASYYNASVTWYENSDGLANFGPRQILSTLVYGAFSVFAADLDGDGDLDALSASRSNDTVGWYENRGGQFSLATVDVAQGVVGNSELHDLLKITATHEGRTGDADVELASLVLQFDNGGGTPLSEAGMNTTFAGLRLYLDDGAMPDVFDSADTMVASTTNFSSANDGGSPLTWTLPDDDANLQVAFGSPKTYFLVAELSASTEAFDVEHLTESSSTGEDAPNDIPLLLEFAANVQSGAVSTTLGDSTCHAPFDLQLADRTVGGSVTCEAGTVLTTGANVVVSGTLTLRAGQAVDMDDGLAVEGALTAEIDPGLEP
jgi:FG-GAP-like repeat